MIDHRLALGAVLLFGAILRIWVLLTQTYVIFADETFQYLEQGHRLAFGYGVVPWEYHDGIRSWLLPGLIAGLMRIGSWLGDGPALYLLLTRGACVALSLTVVWAGFRIAERIGGLGPAVVTGLFCAVWFDLIWFAPVVLTEVAAAHLLIIAAVLGDDDAGDNDLGDDDVGGGSARRRFLTAGACLGLAFCLRYQYAFAIAAIALAQYRLAWPKWRNALAGGIAVALIAGGLLDWLSWGAPFQSVWLHFLRNTVDGVGSAIGTDPPLYYLQYLLVALWPAPLLLALAVLGATRVPALGLAALLTLLVHSAVPHKEVRFIYLALAVAPILIGVGVVLLLDRFRLRQPVVLAAVVVVWSGLSWMGATGQALAARWSLNRGPVQAFLAASRLPALCGLAVRDMRLIDSGGYTYLHRDVRLFFTDTAAEVSLPGSRVPLRFSVARAGKDEPPSPITSNGGYNTMIAHADKGDNALPRIQCFTDQSRPGEPAFCVFHDPGRRCD